MTTKYSQSSRILAIGVVSLVALSGCSSSSDYNFESSEASQKRLVPVSVAFDPTNGVFPLPNDLLFSGSADGTINIPVADDTNFGDPAVALNTLDGFSTVEPIVANFGQTPGEAALTLVNAESIVLGETVRVFEVTRGAQTEVTSVVGELTAAQVAAQLIPADPTTSANGSSLAIVPVAPLKQSTTYMVVVTNGVEDELGRNIGRGATFNILAGTTPVEGPAAALQLLTGAMLANAASAGVNPDDVIMAWSFTTQSITPVLQALKDAAVSTPINVQASGLDTTILSDQSPGLADIYVGGMAVPYYLDAPSAENPIAPLQSFFKNASGTFLSPVDNVPVATGNVTIPVLMTKPKGAAPAGGWPIAIFQHGITSSRGAMLPLADAMASVGYAMIAIDLPMHGITPDDQTFAALRVEGIERTFDVDYLGAEGGGPDGTIDSSGAHFINLTNLLNTRDNTRQGIADLFALSASVNTIADINPAQKVFIGHSLGAIVGTSFLAFEDSIASATLANGTGNVPRMLSASPAFAPTITAGLAGAGIDINSADGNAFLNAAQTAFDSADPINHAAAAAANTNVHMIQVNGDRVVINNMPGFPLVGTEAQARVMGLSQVSATQQGSGFVKFSTGYHSSLLSPADIDVEDDRDAAQVLAAFSEMQRQVAAFASTGTIVVTDPSVIATD